MTAAPFAEHPAVGEVFNPYGRYNPVLIPTCVLRWRDLTPPEKLMLGRVTWHAGRDGKVFPATQTLAHELGLSRRQTHRHKRSLRVRRYLDFTKRPNSSDEYSPLFHPVWHRDWPSSEPGPADGEAFNPFGRYPSVSVPDALMRSPHLTSSQKIVMALILKHAGPAGIAYVRTDQLALEWGHSPRLTRGVVADLIESGLIVRFNDARVKGFTFRYHTFWGALGAPPRDNAAKARVLGSDQNASARELAAAGRRVAQDLIMRRASPVLPSPRVGGRPDQSSSPAAALTEDQRSLIANVSNSLVRSGTLLAPGSQLVMQIAAELLAAGGTPEQFPTFAGNYRKRTIQSPRFWLRVIPEDFPNWIARPEPEKPLTWAPQVDDSCPECAGVGILDPKADLLVPCRCAAGLRLLGAQPEASVAAKEQGTASGAGATPAIGGQDDEP